MIRDAQHLNATPVKGMFFTFTLVLAMLDSQSTHFKEMNVLMFCSVDTGVYYYYYF